MVKKPFEYGGIILFRNEFSQKRKMTYIRFQTDSVSTRNWDFANRDIAMKANTCIHMKAFMRLHLIKTAIFFDVLKTVVYIYPVKMTYRFIWKKNRSKGQMKQNMKNGIKDFWRCQTVTPAE